MLEMTLGSTDDEPGPQTAQGSFRRDPGIWGSLIPLDKSSTHISQIDFRTSKRRYVVGRRKSHEVDFAFPLATSMGESPIRLFLPVLLVPPVQYL